MTPDGFRRFGYIEAVSLLVLLCLAMPLKYIFDMPVAVSVVGMIHGILFIMYVLLGAAIRQKLGWSYVELAFACIIASVPIGPFIFDRQMFSKVRDH
jgi:integral membrane protein